VIPHTQIPFLFHPTPVNHQISSTIARNLPRTTATNLPTYTLRPHLRWVSPQCRTKSIAVVRAPERRTVVEHLHTHDHFNKGVLPKIFKRTAYALAEKTTQCPSAPQRRFALSKALVADHRLARARTTYLTLVQHTFETGPRLLFCRAEWKWSSQVR
jgi:hypothetical protein